MPRNLTLLQIDDDLCEQRQASIFIDPVAVGQAFKYGIDEWLTSIKFWISYERRQPIDLITADIRFTADRTTPLLYDKTIGASEDKERPEEFLIPTGLSHLKPFAAIARATGRPMGIAVHTADVRGWKARLISKNDAVRTMAYLAAHEIGEVAAILGDLTDFEDKSQEERLDECWNWLSDRTYATFDEAWRPALQSYRESLIRGAFTAQSLRTGPQGFLNGSRLGPIIVLPSDWLRMAAWCERMQARKEAILADEDPGFCFLLADGSQESIFFKSLFADAHLALHGYLDLEIESLPTRCFRIEAHENCYKLDESGFPLIGAFLNEFRDLSDAYELAVSALEVFPVSQRARAKLGDVLSPANCGPLVNIARLLAILFQTIRKDRSLICAWESAYQLQAWDTSNNRFDQEIFDSSAPTLARIVLGVYSCAKRFHDGFSAAELIHEWNSTVQNDHQIANRRTIERCICILLSWRRLIYREEDDLYDVCDFSPIPREAVPPVPLILPEGILDAQDVRCQDVGPFLRDVFGYGAPRPNDNQIGRFVADALGLEARAGREFLSEFVNGAAASWIKELCRVYARDKLLWLPSDTWPLALQDSLRG
jgi:hypothetical protein